ncbi:MAG: DsbA family protein [Fimbriimonadaceae bacterium]|nr:DsbA family protein [Fimbriimonadaceae bacterium]
MSLVIPVAHDPTCPWCWIAISQVRRLRDQFDVEFDWLGYELYPESLPWPEPSPREEMPANRPPTPSRFELALAAEGIKLPAVQKPRRMRIHHALQSVEFMRDAGEPMQDWVEALYDAYWLRGEAIGEIPVLHGLAEANELSTKGLEEALLARKYSDRIVGFDEEAYAGGVYNVPTFWIGNRRYAEQPYVTLERAVAGALGVKPLAASTTT